MTTTTKQGKAPTGAATAKTAVRNATKTAVSKTEASSALPEPKVNTTGPEVNDTETQVVFVSRRVWPD